MCVAAFLGLSIRSVTRGVDPPRPALQERGATSAWIAASPVLCCWSSKLTLCSTISRKGAASELHFGASAKRIQRPSVVDARRGQMLAREIKADRIGLGPHPSKPPPFGASQFGAPPSSDTLA